MVIERDQDYYVVYQVRGKGGASSYSTGTLCGVVMADTISNSNFGGYY
jgi:hypothetical protein